jgi:uncharacterized protein (DUF58 family)
MIPTLRVYGLLALGGAIGALIAAFWPGDQRLILSVLALLLWNGLLLGLMIYDIRQIENHPITIGLPHLERLSIGRDNPIALTVISHAQTPVTIAIRDGYPLEHFTVSTPDLTATVAANTTETLTYTAQPSRRGEYAWGLPQLRQLSPWGLVWRDKNLNKHPHSTPRSVAVYPDLLALRALTVRLTLQSSGSLRQRRIGMGTDFAELRDYSSGDDPRLIDWKATARRSRPLVRVLEPEQEQTLIILLDRGRLMTAQVQGLQRFDWALNTTLALALAGIHRGDRVGVGVFDKAIHTWIPPQRGQVHLNQMIERLTPIQPDFSEPDYLAAVTALTAQQSRRALVVVITDLVDRTASQELLTALGRMTPRYLPFCVTLRDPQIDAQAEQFTEDGAGTYGRAVALDLLAQRQAAFAQLRQQGVLVLDAPAHQMSDRLVDRYLQLKLRSQL